MRVIKNVESFEGEFSVPGDKSITHRALMLNSAASGEAVITNALCGEDCLATCACMRALGAKIDVDGSTMRVRGVERFRAGRELNCGNSGTTLRLLTGLVAGKGVDALLKGDASLSARPMERVARPLGLLGANVRTTDGHAPVFVAPAELVGRKIVTDVASAQVKSAVLLAGLSAGGVTVVEEPARSRDHTERMLAAMGAKIAVDGNRVSVEKSTLSALNVDVPADISSASFLMALGALKGKTLCKRVGINPTRTGILTAFDRMGVQYSLLNKTVSGGEEAADILVKKSPIRAVELGGEEIPSMIDELPLIAMMLAFADGESRIRDARELRFKESDRILTTAEMINRLGGECIPTEDGWMIRGKRKLQGGTVDSALDHRIAMSAAVGMLASEKGGQLLRPECCGVSFPNFFNLVGAGV
jgi:3-phosphoshikimate 1-carboxyvinyltransferase